MRAGCVVGVGSTDEGNPVLLYGLSCGLPGRYPSSQPKTAFVYRDRVFIGPCGITPEQGIETGRFLYCAINSYAAGSGAVGNGHQTVSICKYHLENATRIHPQDAIRNALTRWARQGKTYAGATSIAGMVSTHAEQAGLGFITAKKRESARVFLVRDFHLTRGIAGYLSTHIPVNFYEAVTTRRIEGKTSRELAEEMYESMGPELAVAAAVALWIPQNKGWELAVKNKG